MMWESSKNFTNECYSRKWSCIWTHSKQGVQCQLSYNFIYHEIECANCKCKMQAHEMMETDENCKFSTYFDNMGFPVKVVVV